MLNSLRNLLARLWFQTILFMLAYAATTLVSQEISFKTASFPTVWLPSGLFVAVLLLSDVGSWPAYLLAAFPVSMSWSLLTGHPLPDSILLYISGALEATTGAWLVRRFDPNPGRFSSPGNVLTLILCSALVSTALSAFINTTVLATLQSGVPYWATFRVAWIGQSLGVLVVAPLILSWAKPPAGISFRIDPERLIELAIITTGLFVCSLYIFVGSFTLNKQSYMIVPFMVWVALRFGSRGVTFSGLIVTFVANWGTIRQLSGFANNDMTIAPNMDVLGIFLGITLITSYILATVWEQGKTAEIALRDSEARYRNLVDKQAEGVGILDTGDVFTFANPAAISIFGADPLVGRNLKSFLDASQQAIIEQQIQLGQASGKVSFELEIRQPGGKRCSLLVSASPEYNPAGQWAGTFAVFHDITERKQVEVALRDSRAHLQTLFEHSPIPIWEEDFSRVKRMLDGLRRQGVEDLREYFNDQPEQLEACEKLIRLLDVNQAVIQQFNFADKTEFIAQFNTMMNRGPKDIFVEELVAISEGKTEFAMEGPNDLVDGVIRYHNVRWTVAPGYERDYRRLIITIIDVTERKQAEEHMRYLSTHDVLTGLYNRNFFEAELERLQNSRLEPINVMVVDVNGMKVTNDTFGHAAGDDLLRRTAQVLRMSFRKEDIIARIGGDEFVVLFHGSIPIQDSVARVKNCLNEHNHWFDGSALSLSIGASTGAKGSSLVELFKKADQQMYKEKNRSRKSHAEVKLED